MKQSIYLLFTLSTLLFCKKNNDCKTITYNNLEGKWEEVRSEVTNVSFAGRNHEFTFFKDSFLLERYQYTDALSVDPNCGGGSWYEYAKGIVILDDNSVELDGVYTNENYIKLDSTLCPSQINIGVYNFIFDNASFCNNTLSLLNSSAGNWRGKIELQKVD